MYLCIYKNLAAYFILKEVRLPSSKLLISLLIVPGLHPDSEKPQKLRSKILLNLYVQGKLS
jgi:hypothetical protein